MARTTLQQEDIDRDASFVKLMHGKSAEQRNAFMSMLNKDRDSHRVITDGYVKLWEADDKAREKTQEARDDRKEKYMSLVNR
jgi:sterol 24-C-methyltransferase